MDLLTKHNTVCVESPLIIKIESDNEMLTVSNNIIPKVTQTSSTGLGQKYIRQQYLDLSGKPISIRQTETEYVVTSSDFLSKLKKRLPLLKTCLGSPKQCFYFALDTNLHMTLLQQKGITPEVFNQTFNIHESSSYKEETQGFPFIYLFKKFN